MRSAMYGAMFNQSPHRDASLAARFMESHRFIAEYPHINGQGHTGFIIASPWIPNCVPG